jgi:hypothetical protein
MNRKDLSMTDHQPGAFPIDSVPGEVPETLTGRMLARVNLARLAVDRRANATRSRLTGPRRARPASPHAPRLEEVRESRALKRVFHDLGVTYRCYRSQTGGRVAPGLRDAAYDFRKAPSLTSLVAVAAFLDERDLLS